MVFWKWSVCVCHCVQVAITCYYSKCTLYVCIAYHCGGHFVEVAINYRFGCTICSISKKMEFPAFEWIRISWKWNISVAREHWGLGRFQLKYSMDGSWQTASQRASESCESSQRVMRVISASHHVSHARQILVPSPFSSLRLLAIFRYPRIGIGFIVKDARRLGFKECFFLCSGHVTYHIWCDSWNVTEEEPSNLCLTNSQTFVIISPCSICQMLANFSEAEF